MADITQEVLDDCIVKILSGFEASRITIVEWETRLLRRLDAPLKKNPDLVFLVPDEQLDKANEIVASNGLKIDENIHLSPGYLIECSAPCFRYVYGEPKKRFILGPLSWTIIDKDELEVAQPDGHYPPLPCTLHTLPRHLCCAALLHIIFKQDIDSAGLRRSTVSLSHVIGDDRLFDYSGGSQRLTNKRKEPGWTLEKELMESNIRSQAALEQMKTWPFTKKYEWTKEALMSLVIGEVTYRELLDLSPPPL